MRLGKTSEPRELELLYFSRGDTLASVSHEHPFYQLEIGISGELHGRSDETWVCIRPQHFWLIPPETPHCFVRAATGTEFYSLKFTSSVIVPAVSTSDEVSKYHVGAIASLLENGHVPSPYTACGKEIVEAHLWALLRHLEEHAEQAGATESDFIMRLREIICYHGYMINVKELTNIFQCTRSQLKYRFSKEAGGQTSLKQFINQVLLELVTNHVRYSDRSFTQIAHLTKFPELSLFSRFIKKNTGMSPVEFRQKLEREHAH